MTDLPILFGWGKKGKPIGYIGIEKCPNCKNYVHFSIYEYSNRINIYFIPVAKFNKKSYLVCPVCDAAFELTGDLKKYYFSEMLYSMNIDDTQEIFSKSLDIIIDNFDNILTKDKTTSEDKIDMIINMCIKKLKTKYNNEVYIDKIARIALKFLLDDDKAN